MYAIRSYYVEEIGFEVVRIKPDCNGEIEYDSIVSEIDEKTLMVFV